MSKEIFDMAKEAGAFGYVHDSGETPYKWSFTNDQLKEFVRIVLAKNLEARIDMFPVGMPLYARPD